jgi:murein DD-endopeptidase MepM/ murein hydrolase activator NlpD
VRRLAVVLAGLAMLATVASVPARATTQEELEAARDRVREIRRELAVEQERLDAINAEMKAINRRIAEQLSVHYAIRDRIRFTRDEVRDKEERQDRLQDRLNDRAHDAYVQGPAGLVAFLLEADSLTNLSDRLTFLDILSLSDANLAAGVELEGQQLERHQDDLEFLLGQQDAVLERLAGEERELQAKWRAQEAIEARIEEKLTEAEQIVEDLRERLAAEILAQLAAQNPAVLISGPSPFDVCPVDEPNSYINDFGFPRSGGRTHQGNDIFAPSGTPIRAPFDGTASESWNGLGGLAVIVYASDGSYVYNAHLSRYAGVDGQHVEAGTLIGYVGDTGNAVGTPPHDHFEYHPGGGSAVTPYYFLNQVCL